MNTERLLVRGIPIDVVRKDIKHLHLGVYPPAGRVRVAAPTRLADDTLRLAVVTRLGWIRRQRARFEGQSRQSEREMVAGEAHYFQGRRYRLAVVERPGRPEVRLAKNATMELLVPPGTSAEGRRRALDAWYRTHLRERIPQIVAEWEPKLGVRVDDWRLKRMKTRWGTCNTSAGRIWINVELAKKPALCLDFIVVHEMVHLLERHHSERFHDIMNRAMPQWRRHRAALNREPLAYEQWHY